VDLSKYGTALKLCENFVVQPFGGVTSRPGTEFLAEALDSAKPLKLIPFQFSVEQGYILEFGDQTMRVYRDGIPVLADISGIIAWVITTGYTVGQFVLGTLDDSQTTTWTEGVGYDVGDYVHASSGGIKFYFRCLRKHTADEAKWPWTDTDHWENLGGSPLGIYRCIQNHTSTANDEPWHGINWTTYWVLDGYALGVYELAVPYAAEDLARLTYEQSYDVLFLQHPDHAPQQLSRTAHNAWAIAAVTFGAGIGAPTVLTGGTGTSHEWQVTAVADDGQESLPSNTKAAASGTLTWTPPAVGTVHYYNIYMRKNLSGSFGWVAREAAASHVVDATVLPDYQKGPPEANAPFGGVGDYPGVASFFEQRMVYARTNNNPQTIWGSVTGAFGNFNISTPLSADDSYQFTLASRQLQEIRWLIALEDLLIGTGGGEWRMSAGGTSGAVTPTNVDLKMQSQWGSSYLRPVVIGNAILFVDGSKRVLRDLIFNLDVEGYAGNDLTLLANHLFNDREIVDLAYQQHPDTVVWAVRDDGVLLGMTYAREHEVWGWHRHTTDGLVENVATIFTEAGEVDTYIVVKRNVGGSDVKHIEVFRERLPSADITRAWAVDDGLRYDGWVLDTSYTMTLTGGSTWQVGESLTLTSSSSNTFLASDVGKYIKLSDGVNSVIVSVTGYTSDTVLTVTPYNRVVPTAMQAVGVHNWVRMITSFSGLEHLEGKTVQIFTDGNVQPEDTVSSGAITLPEPAARALIGLGYVCNLETMEIEIAAEGGTLQDRLRNAVSVMTRMENSRGLWVGPDEDHLDEVAFREDELYGEPTQLYTGDKEMAIEPSDGMTGRIYLRNNAPVPTTVLSIIPKMDFGED